MRNRKQIQTSESLMVGSILAVVGGFLDTYSYLCRGGVFANAETGNIVLFAINLAEANWGKALHYLLPILAFAAGVLISAIARGKKDSINVLHWRQITVLIEIVVLGLTAFLPQELNLIVNSIISLTCGIQVAAFAKFHDHAMATTMCTGNLRSGMQWLYRYIETGDKVFLKKSGLYFGCILWFIVGVILGGRIVGVWGEPSILAAAAGLLVVLVLMFAEERTE